MNSWGEMVQVWLVGFKLDSSLVQAWFSTVLTALGSSLACGGLCRMLAPRGILIVCGVAPLMIRAIECSCWTVSNLMCDSKGLGQTTAHAVADWVKFWAQ